MELQVDPSATASARWHAKNLAARRILILITGFVLLLSTGLMSAEIPPSVVALAKKYDEARQKTLGPLLGAFADGLKLKTVPALTRAGNLDAAIQIDQAATGLKGAQSAAMPREGAPFSPAAWAVVIETEEWKVFSETFAKEESSLNDLYMKALEREKAAFQANGNPYGVLAVENEVKRVESMRAAGVPKDPKAGPASPPLAVAAAEKPWNEAAPAAPMVATIDSIQKKATDAYFVGKLWKTPQWKDEIHEWYFRKNGEAVRRITKVDGTVAGIHTMRWTVDPDSTVCVASDSPAPKFFWFSPDGTAEYRLLVKEGKREPITLIPNGKDPAE